MSEMSNSQATAIAAVTNKAKVSSGDTTADYLATKLVAGTAITVTKNNAGANETLTIATSASDGFTAKITASDTTPGYLQAKLSAGTGLSITKQNAGANENVKIDIPFVCADITADESITIYYIVRKIATGIVAARANSIANATAVIGILTAGVSSGSLGNVVCSGYAIIDVEGALSSDASVYLSVTTAGKGTFTVPTSGQVKYAVGRAVKVFSGSQYWVQLCFDREPLTV